MNWRYGVLLAVFAVSLVLFVSESESMVAFLLSKVAGVGGFALFGWLVRRWSRAGKIDELAQLAEE